MASGAEWLILLRVDASNFSLLAGVIEWVLASVDEVRGMPVLTEGSPTRCKLTPSVPCARANVRASPSLTSAVSKPARAPSFCRDVGLIRG